MDEKKTKESIAALSDLIGLMSSIDKSAICHLETAIEALEKQLPKKVKIYNEGKYGIDFECPNCGQAFLAETVGRMKCCPYCECKLDWGE